MFSSCRPMGLKLSTSKTTLSAAQIERRLSMRNRAVGAGGVDIYLGARLAQAGCSVFFV